MAAHRRRTRRQDRHLHQQRHRRRHPPLKATAADAEGTDASAAFTLSAPAVTASVTVTADPAKAPYGVTDGQVEASAADGTVAAHTLIGLDREEERYGLTITSADRTGAALPGTAVVHRTGGLDHFPVEIPDSGRLTLRLPKGEYAAAARPGLDLHLTSTPTSSARPGPCCPCRRGAADRRGKGRLTYAV
ncbi:hypothetical protein [Streptomyces sp. NBC_01477]|uniref:hypothetical protein n=1 Tax=Streptomyces sp. NBC_01477 TaxID=2976015 RepID=UPI002E2EF50D|nr:hypothetical protein [Streptomyces sp. NBC_01477]